MSYLLDTNAVVALLRNKPAAVRERYREAGAAGDYLAVSSVVLFELWSAWFRRGLTVVTANASEFGRVPGLNWVDWTG